jgi:hypothetical protein
MTAISTAPAVLDYLVELAASLLPNLQVTDGQPIDPRPDLLAIGFTGLPGEPVVQASQAPDQFNAAPDRETYDVACFAYSLRGGKDLKVVRDQVYATVATFAAGLRTDPTLGDLVGRARLSVVSFMQQQSTSGAEADLRFAISIDAWTR